MRACTDKDLNDFKYVIEETTIALADFDNLQLITLFEVVMLYKLGVVQKEGLYELFTKIENSEN